MNPKPAPIAVIGMACRFPHAADLPGLWRVVSSGEVTFEAIDDSRWKHGAFVDTKDVRAPDKTYVLKGAFLDGVDEFAALHYGMAPRRVQVMDPQQRLAIEATRQALQDAGYDTRPFDKLHTGVFLGASVSEYRDLMTARHRALQLANGEYGDALSPAEQEAVRAAVADVVPARAFSIAGGLLNMIACSVSQAFDLSGPAMQIDAACSSALVAIHEAVVNLRAGVVNVAVAGGVYLNLGPDNLIGFSRIGAISPSGACRPFDAKADGFVMGEGVGVVILKRLEDAERDGDRVYAVIRGSGCNNDGRGEGPMTPRPEGQKDAMRRAHEGLDFGVDTISYVETHGTATTVGDVVEVGALRQFFGERLGRPVEAPYCWLGSIKANVGHTMSAAGVAGFIKTCLMMHHGVIPPQPAVEELNPKLDLPSSPFQLTAQAVPWTTKPGVPRRAAVSSFGFGGTNAHVVLEAPLARRSSAVTVAAEAQQPQLVLLSAPTPALLAASASQLAAHVEAHRLSVAQVGSALANRQAFDARVAFLATSRDELVRTLKDVSAALSAHQPLPVGVAYAEAPLPAEARKLAFLFPGQGAQKVGLLEGLVKRSPFLAQRLTELDAAAREAAGCSIVDALYPKDRTDPSAAQAHLTRTEVCQPAMAALGLALSELLGTLGLTADVALGHSLGEFAAAASAGMLSAEDAVSLVARRGQLMNELELTDPGAMLAVMASAPDVEGHLEAWRTSQPRGSQAPALANHNHPTQVVLSGTTPGIEAAQQRLSAAGLKCTRLDVSHAFHSPLMAGIDAGMAQLVGGLPVHAPQRAVVSCISGRRYESAAEAKAIWVKHATAPVKFVDALEACVTLGASLFVQVGAGNALTSFARGVAKQAQGFYTLGSADGADGVMAFLQTLGALWVKGAPVNAAPLFERPEMALLPPSLLETQRYWAVERVQRAPRQPLVAPSPPAGAAAGASLFSSPSLPTNRGVPMNDLIALFQQQMQLLQSQAEILKAQSNAIASLAQGQAPQLAQAMAQVTTLQAAAGGAVGATVMQQPVVMPAVVSGPAPAANGANGHGHTNGHAHAKPVSFSNLVSSKEPERKEAAPAPAPVVDVKPQVTAKVLEAVARISAFPQGSLKAEQTLVGELGFDSLMLVELDQSIGKAFPQLGGLPRELFGRGTTVATVIDYVADALTRGVSKAEAEGAPVAAVERRLPTVTPAPLATLTESVVRFDRPVLVTRDGAGLAEALAKALSQRGVAATVGALDTPGDFGGVVHLAVGAQGDYRAPTRALLQLAQRLTAEKAELFVTVTGLGGGFGLSGTAPELLGQAGAIGFTQALAQEWSDALVKAIDVDPALPAADVAQHLVDELFSGDRTTEVGFTKQGRVAVSLLPMAAPAKAATLSASSVIVLTGGAKGVGLKLAKGLAKATGATLALTGRSAPSEEVAKACAQVKAAGAKACTYHPMDVRDAASVKAALDAIRAAHGRVDGVVHGAGVLADALVEKKTLAAVDGVLETKVGGALALLEATKGDALTLFAGIGSWAGRFGNAAQTDYSAANRMLARVARAGTRCVTIDSPPWEDSEMARKIPGFKKAELKASGVTFLGDDEGVAAFLVELLGGAGEVLLGRDLPQRTVMHATSFPVSRLNHVYLNDHTMAGQRVVPLAAALDHAVAAALDVAPAAALGFSPFTVTDFALERAILVPDTTWLDVAVTQQLRDGEGALRVTLSQGAARSYAGTVTRGAHGEAPAVRALAAGGPLPMALEDFYRGFTFHGPRLQGITRIEALADDGVVGWVKGSTPADWVKEPLRATWAVDPLVIDASFQLAGYWAWTKQQRAGFPIGVGRFVQRLPFGPGPIKCTVTFEASSDDVFSGTLVWQDAQGAVLAYMTGAKAEFKRRDPTFTSQAPKASAPRPVVAAAPAPAPVVAAPALAPADEAEAVSPAPVAVDESTWNPAKFPEYEALQERLQMAEAFGLRNPYFSVHEAVCGDTTVVGGKEMINFSSYNYVGNSGDPVVSKAAQDAIAKYGTSVSASRVASGEKPLTLELERALADFFGAEDCIALVSGHATNVTVIGHVVGAGDLILHDALAHDSIIQGAKLSGAKRRPFPHNDFAALDRMLTNLRPHYRRVLVCIEGTYSMDGDIPELPKFIEVKKKHKAMLLVDEAHSAGVIGRTGRGIGEYFDVNRADVDMWMGTLSKSFASCGGYVAGSHALVEYLKYTTPGFVYSVGLAPPNCAAALASTKNILAHPERVQRLQQNAKYFLELLHARGINTGMSKDTAVVPAIIGNSVLCLQLSDALKTRGINVQPILYPAVEEDMARLRFFISSLHKPEQLLQAADTLKEELDRLTRELNGDAVA
ncbi:MAG: aminotransferase class I/II-fold pyridoxal phosphate-dependent enzyme [Myxococcaceae bacterium]|jgi:acyl transferase domain-containing protein/7-keto-8-aminopelargonate synthetase-like enzyme|nr:aminotransferase class I/II-fold pyridoxal phosphate-dependent enzyme [Myxococcaceae bacterium]